MVAALRDGTGTTLPDAWSPAAFLLVTAAGAPCVDGPEKLRSDGGQVHPCVRPHMRAFVSSYFIAASFMFIRHGYESVFSPRRSSRHKQGTSLQTSHPAGRRPHHGPAFGTGELQEGGNHSVRRRLTRQAGQRRRPLGSVCPCRLAARVQFARSIRIRTSSPHPLVPRPGSRTATRRSEAAVPSPPP